MDTVSKSASADFSLAQSGRLNTVLRWLHLEDDTPKGYVRRSLVMVGATWLPMLILSAMQGLAWGNRVDINFLKDFSIHFKFILVLSLLIFSESSVDQRLSELTGEFFKSGILGEKDLPALDRIKKRIKQLSETVVADWVILIVVIVNIYIRWRSNANNISMWFLIPDQQGEHISLAGYWYALFALPVFQYIVFRWFWRWILWFIYFLKISKLPLQLRSAHPDKAGGLGFLGIPPAPFLQVTLAVSIIFSTTVAVKIFWLHHRLPEYYPIMGGFILICILINILPLIVFLKPMIKQRRKGIFEYSALIARHHREFDEKWLRKTDVNALLGSQDASSTTDLNSTFDTVMSMGVFPFNIKTMVSSILIGVLPMLPLLAFEYDWLELLKKILGMLI
jgi:hypothetical protein